MFCVLRWGISNVVLSLHTLLESKFETTYNSEEGGDTVVVHTSDGHILINAA